jgi:hypothetical protein
MEIPKRTLQRVFGMGRLMAGRLMEKGCKLILAVGAVFIKHYVALETALKCEECSLMTK